MTYYLIAGEASGDLHGANLIKAIQKHDASAEFRCLGGDRMERAGAKLVRHYRETAYMGFWEVVKNLPVIFRNLRFCREDIRAYQPDVLILIDYPGFNLRIAEQLKDDDINIFYYISPQVWAWKASRVQKIKTYVDRMFVILPFEQAFYKRWGMVVDFVGHPLLDAIEQREQPKDFRQEEGLSDKPIIALLPGSRAQEIKMMLPLMLSVQPHFPDYQFIVAGLSYHSTTFYQQQVAGYKTAIVTDRTYDLLSCADAALVTSGTATLETALHNVPQVVCYKGNPVSFWIGKQLVDVAYISLVNLILEEELVQELIQSDLTKENLQRELATILQPDTRQYVQQRYEALKQLLGEQGASDRAAKLMVGYLEEE